jgi:hypothetical protein
MSQSVKSEVNISDSVQPITLSETCLQVSIGFGRVFISDIRFYGDWRNLRYKENVDLMLLKES